MVLCNVTSIRLSKVLTITNSVLQGVLWLVHPRCTRLYIYQYCVSFVEALTIMLLVQWVNPDIYNDATEANML